MVTKFSLLTRASWIPRWRCKRSQTCLSQNWSGVDWRFHFIIVCQFCVRSLSEMSNTARNRLHSTWTPLSNGEANHKIYEERRDLVGRWFDKWSDTQRKKLLADLLSKCKTKQIEFAGDVVNRKRPIYRDDFSRILPRVLSLYIFSFLDPRSLCRCSQVCWYWKYLSELDQIWMPKCVRVGWILPFSPSPYEIGVWKKLYIENIVALKCLTPKIPQGVPIRDLENMQLTDRDSLRGTPRPGSTSNRPPWKGSDPVPKDTWRNNYLANDDEISKVQKLRKKGYYGAESEEMFKKAKTKLQTGKDLAGKRPPSAITRSRSTPRLNGVNSPDRPDWAKANQNSVQLTEPSAFQPLRSDTTTPDASVRPPPVKTVRVTTNRSARDPPSKDLFPDKPWQVPADEDYDSESY